MQCSRAQRIRAWEGCFATTEEAFPEESSVVQQHLGQGRCPLSRLSRVGLSTP
jgi:hypothetical protein